MDETELDLKCEEDRRLVCCVCDTRKFCSNADYICSRNCEKLFLLIQGLVVGNALQSLFTSLFVGKENLTETALCERLWLENAKAHTQTRSTQQESPQLPVSPRSQSDHTRCESQDCMQVSSLERLNNGTPDYQLLPTKTQVKTFVRSTRSNKAADLVSPSTDSEKAKFEWSDPSRVGKHRNSISQQPPGRKMMCISNRNKKRILPSHKKTHQLDDQVNISSSDLLSTSSELADCQPTTINKAKPEQSGEKCDEESGKKTGKTQVKCRRCGKLVSKYYLYVHYRATHQDHLSDITQSSVSCSECGKLFMRKQALNTHRLKHHNHQFPNTCKHCGKGFANRLGLSWHMRQVHKMTIRQCGTCGETFENRREYKKHRRYKHTMNSHVCHVCGKGFKLKNALQAHLDAHAGIKLHYCEICGDGFVRFSSLCQHKNNLHGPKKSELPFKCHVCPSTFRLQAWLDKHIAQKHQSSGSSLQADCDLCQSSLHSSVSCPLHADAGTESFTCHQCNKVFAKETSLKAHMKQHQEPQFSCDVCHKKFTYKCNMQRHRDTHSTEKPFYCDICSKHFCSKFLLASHKRMHNQDLLFKCDICGKGLTRKDYLKNHLKKMHPEHTLIQQTQISS